jgi:hypothetical protein
MKYLAISTNTKDVSPFVAAEFQRVDKLRAAGTITGGWLKADFSGAVLVLECADAAEATAALDTLPTAINDATTFVLTEIIDADSARPSVSREHLAARRPGGKPISPLDGRSQVNSFRQHEDLGESAAGERMANAKGESAWPRPGDPAAAAQGRWPAAAASGCQSPPEQRSRTLPMCSCSSITRCAAAIWSSGSVRSMSGRTPDRARKA